MTAENDINRFSNYRKLLKLTAPWTELAVILTQEGKIYWQDDTLMPHQKDQVTSYFNEFHQQCKESKTSEKKYLLDDKNKLTFMWIENLEQTASLTLALISTQDNQEQQLSAQSTAAIDLLNQTLLTEYALLEQNQNKEKELDAIANELTERYEELNLLYSSGENVQNLSHGRDLLKQIVTNASNFLAVDQAVILLPGKNLTLHYPEQSNAPEKMLLILKVLRKEVFQKLETLKISLVINHHEDAVSAGVPIDMPCKIIVTPIFNAENTAIGLMAIINQHDKTDFSNSDRNLLEVLANKASSIVVHNFDLLTGLENGYSFEMIMLDTLKQSWQNGSHHVVASIDIDHMKVINAISGVEAGDRLIKQVGKAISKQVRSYDTVARPTGDKFAIILKNCSLEKAKQLLKKIALAVTKIKLRTDQADHEISISIGIAPITADIQNISSILTNVESARNAAKERGSNQIQVFKLNDEDLLRRQNLMLWASKTQAALRENRFVIYAQLICPVVKNQQLPHFEVLIRMLNKAGDIVPPNDFLPAAEKYFLMPKIDRWVINATFKQLNQQLESSGKHTCKVSINLSGQSLTSEGLHEFIQSRMKMYSINPKLICFEVTESAAMTNLVEAQKFISIIRSMGCKFSLDDFGTGLSSFAYLQNLDVDYLKIDGSFVKNIIENPVSHSMVSAINQVGHSMNLKTIAEYVENDSILNGLKEIGIDYAQGFGINKPQPFTEQLSNINVSVKPAQAASNQ